MQNGLTQLYTKIVELVKIFVRLLNKLHFVNTIILTASSKLKNSELILNSIIDVKGESFIQVC